MSKEIKKIDDKHIAIIETTVNERLIARVTLETQREILLAQIVEIDDMLRYFK